MIADETLHYLLELFNYLILKHAVSCRCMIGWLDLPCDPLGGSFLMFVGLYTRSTIDIPTINDGYRSYLRQLRYLKRGRPDSGGSGISWHRRTGNLIRTAGWTAAGRLQRWRKWHGDRVGHDQRATAGGGLVWCFCPLENSHRKVDLEWS